ncbi:hypothetical protein [Nocardioides lijunqiniae]|uniref:hypothetical protein n=1 Tax=Nocardioides lijunqiniae TaxID=2760832 RepID=UPI001878DDA6|nr:hypothetical protein [Nocardioides lijunqiniae]
MSAIEWLAATLSPWAIAPHPNFREDSINEVQFLALLVESRLVDFAEYRAKIEPAYDEWADELIDSAYDYLVDGQDDGYERLVAIARRDGVPLGARAAAAFLCCLDLRWDREVVTINLLGTLQQDAAEVGTQSRERDLVTVAISVQLLMRRLDRGELTNTDELSEVLLIADRLLSSPSDAQAVDQSLVSRGVDISGAILFVDIASMLRHHTLEMMAKVEGVGGRSWIDVLRTMPAWSDVRLDWKAASRDRAIANTNLKRQADSLLNRVQLGGEPAPGIVDAYSAVRVAELTASFGDALSGRAALAGLLLTNREKWEAEEVQELLRDALKLMVSARSKDGLEVALAVLRTEGPLEALTSVTEEAIAALAAGRPATALMMRLVEGGADLLRDDSTATVLSIIRSMRPTDDDSVKWALRLCIELTHLSNDVSDVITAALDLLRATSRRATLFARELRIFSEKIQWLDVDIQLREEWGAWVSEALAGDRELVIHLRGVVLAESVRAQQMSALDMLVAYVNETKYVSGLATSDAVSKTLTELASLHAGTQRDSGFSMSSVDVADVAVLVALRSSDIEVWNAIVDFITDPHVIADYKTGAIARIADFIEEVPALVQNALKDSWPTYGRQPVKYEFFSHEVRELVPQMLRLASVLGAENAEYLLGSVTRMSSSRKPRHREDAAALIPWVVQATESSDWGCALSLQLSTDADLTVRGAALRSLGSLVSTPGAVGPLVIDQASSALTADSVRLPLYVLQGIDGDDVEAQSLLKPQVTALARNHRSRRVRVAALDRLAAWERSAKKPT